MGKEKKTTEQPKDRVRSSDIAPHILRQYHVREGFSLMKYGLAADRPDTGNECLFWFSTDTFVMSYWDSITETWKASAPFS